jgi:low temperature requirement protein LtrA
MFRFFAVLVRTTYLVTVLVTLALLVPWAFDGLSAAFLLAIFIVPAARALYRLIRFRELIPDARLREAPIVATLVFVSSAIASFLLVNLVWAFLTRAGRDVELAPFVFFGLFWLAIALLTGEIVLVGRRKKGTDLFVDAPHGRREAADFANK